MSKQKTIMKDIAEYQHYVLDKLIEDTEVIYSPKLDYSDSWYFIKYPYHVQKSIFIGESFEHPASPVKFKTYVQDYYGIIDVEVSSLWQSYKKYIYDLSRDIERRGPNDIDLVT